MVNNLANNLTVLGLHGVPESVREAALSCGASKWYLLTKVDLPLASPSIRAGINQTIMLSLAMVVVASLSAQRGLVKCIRSVAIYQCWKGYIGWICHFILRYDH